MNIFKIGARLSGSIIAAAVISFFLCISINVICTALFTNDVGYNAYVYTEDSEDPVDEYQYLYNDTDGDGKDNGSDSKKLEYEKQGYIVTTYNLRSALDGSGKMVFLIVTQVLGAVLLISFASSSVYKQGFKDANLARTGHIKVDYLKGFKIGAVANIPFFTLFVLLIILAAGASPNFRTVWYAFLNSHVYPAVLWIVGDAEVVSELDILQYVLLFLVQLAVPVTSGVAYILGFKEINLADKLVYKKGEI